MTRPHTDNERQLIDPGRRARLESAIDAAINTGIRAQRLHTDPGTEPAKTFTEGNLIERTAGIARHRIGCTNDTCSCRDDDPERVSEEAKRVAIVLPEIIRTHNHAAFRLLENLYLPGRHHDQADIPGVTDPNPGRCVTHWAAGKSVAAAKGRKRCHRCDDFHRHTGADYPPVVISVYVNAVESLLTNMPSGASKRDRQRARIAAEVAAWDHPWVLRAWDASGWNARAGVRYPEPRTA